MEGGTSYHFVSDGIEAALKRAREAAGEKNVSIAGGPSTLNQYLAAGLVDELRLHVAPFVAGGGERVFAGAAGDRAEAGEQPHDAACHPSRLPPLSGVIPDQLFAR